MSNKVSKFTISIDWEDFGQLGYKYFSGIVTPPLNNIERQTRLILSILEQTDTKATFFILGMLARYRPDLVKLIHQKGHEIAIHGNMHINMTTLTEKEARQDIEAAIKLVSDIVGEAIYGYRAPLFSLNTSNWYLLDVLFELGLKYDSSIFPMKLPRYGVDNFCTEDKLYKLKRGGQLVELPMTIFEYKNHKFPVSGGGYFRAMPSKLIQLIFQKLYDSHKNAMIYMHPYEFDNQLLSCAANFPIGHTLPKLKELKENIYWNLFRDSIRKKIHTLADRYQFVTCHERAVMVLNSSKTPALLSENYFNNHKE